MPKGKKKVYMVTSNRKADRDLCKEFPTFGAAERYIRSICPDAIKGYGRFKCFTTSYEYTMFVRKEWRDET